MKLNEFGGKELKDLDRYEPLSPEIIQLARSYDLTPSMVAKLQSHDRERLLWMWIKQGHINHYPTFQAVLRFMAEVPPGK